MANENHTSGPVRTLPGTQHEPENGAMCDEHEDILAVAKVQMDTDSFGAEYAYMCADCLALFVKEMNAEKTKESKSECDWCSRIEHLSPVRDSGEGSCGPVYQVCARCASEQVKRDKEEYDELFPQTVNHDDDDFCD